ncbi:MAG: UDP-2,4-diacetamido-2,4,6-trideoxy-beta-L-altropyranose hydrolase [Nitrospirae bacterium]|nr:UDP-2,4-diacetamido-2,4,6-trideoxy-beta-L-altropyranose hydrolase [Nitrospirota bacterium]
MGQRILIRTDASPDIALGHLKRCISLAEGLRIKGVEPVFLSLDDNSAKELLSSFTFESGFINTPINTGDDADKTLSFMRENDLDSVIFDSYSVDAKYLDTFSKKNFKVICMDDLADRPLPCDMVINGGLGAEELKYEAPHKLLGINYCILSRPFREPSAYEENTDVRNVLITMGGIDHYRLSERSMRMLDELPGDFSITVIIGPYYENVKEIEDVAGSIEKDVELIRGSNDLYPFMKKCDMAISAGGFTLYELATLKKPVIGISLWENQYRNVNELDKKGIILGLNYSDDASFDNKLESSIKRLADDSSLRNTMAQRAGRMFDGQGAVRAADEIRKFLEHG